MERAETIFEQVLELEMAERAAFLDRECAGDSALRERVGKLVDAHERAERLEFLPSNLVQVPTEKLGDRIDRYKLLEKIGEGGWGVVYVAEQTKPVSRRVALKVIKLGMDTKAVVARFEAERQALAMMDHPNIARVLDAGSTDTGRPFFVMELVRGIRITDYCDQANLSTSERLDLFIKVCQAIQHAHQKGIIHRDIKPSNILVTLHDGVPVPKVIDFGIAKATEGRLTDATVYTQLHQFIGTPAYMSPEQAEMSGLDIDTRSDIYSLGVLLYELLTGTTPFDAKKLMALGIEAMRKTIREKEPVRPSTQLTQELGAADMRRLNSKSEIDRASSRRLLQIKEVIPLLRGDLDWVVMKCLEKDRGRRYETANGLAADLQRYCANEPVVARPPTPIYRFQKMVRRNKLAFVAASVVVAALLVGLFLTLWQARRAINAEQTTRRNAYAAEISVAFHALDENNLGRARELLDRQRPKPGEDDLRGFEWRYLWQLCQGDEFETFPDEGARAAAYSPKGKLLAYSFGKIIVRETASLKEVVTLPSSAMTLSFAPHTHLLASGNDSGVKLWDTDTWQQVRSLTNTMYPSLFSPDGRWLLTGVAGAFRVWDTETWQPVGDCPGAPQLAFNARNAVAFSPDSQFLVTISGEGWDLGDHLRVWRLPRLEEQLPEIRFESEPGSVAFTADGKHLVTGLWDGQVVVLDFQTRQRLPMPKQHTAWVTVIAVGPDGKSFATASGDRTINLWDAHTFKHLVRLRGHVDAIWSLAMSPDGGTLVSGSSEGTTKLWSAETRHTPPVLEDSGLVAGFSGDGRKLVAGASNGWSVWTPESGARVEVPVPTSPPVADWTKPYDVKADELIGALGRTNGTIELWDLSRGAKITEWLAHSDGISVVAFSRDGKLLATGTVSGEVKLWDLASRREVLRLGPVGCPLMCLAFSPNGKALAASGRSSQVWLWDRTSGHEVRQLGGHASIVAAVAFSPDGTLLATTSYSGDVRLWELPSGTPLPPLKGHILGVTAVAFSPDGKTLATGGFDKKVKLWNVATHQEVTTISTVNVFPWLGFSPDHRTLVVGDMPAARGRIQVLRVPSFDEIAAADEEFSAR